jgi:hypothetical protein
MNLLDRIRRRRDQAPERRPDSPYFGAGWRGSAASFRPAPSEGAAQPSTPTGLPPLNPEPFCILAPGASEPTFTGPRDVTAWLQSGHAHASHGALIAEYDHEALLSSYDSVHVVTGAQPGDGQ